MADRRMRPGLLPNGETVGSIIREWTRHGIEPSRAARWEESSQATYRCVTGPTGKGCGGVSVNAEILDEYVTGAVLDAPELKLQFVRDRTEFDWRF